MVSLQSISSWRETVVIAEMIAKVLKHCPNLIDDAGTVFESADSSLENFKLWIKSYQNSWNASGKCFM